MHRYRVNALVAVFCCLIATGCATQSTTQNTADVPKCAAGTAGMEASNQRCIPALGATAMPYNGPSGSSGHCVCNGPTSSGGSTCYFNSDCDSICLPTGGTCH